MRVERERERERERDVTDRQRTPRSYLHTAVYTKEKRVSLNWDTKTSLTLKDRTTQLT